jgi:phosphoribosylamine--glycine ligase
MKILVIGSGGREHALGRKLSQSSRKPALIFAPGNPGMAELGNCHPVAADDVPGLLDLARKEKADLTVVGPEIPLVKGIVDAFRAAGLRIFGPSAQAARLEGSKAFAKAFMARNGIPTAAFESFSELPPALAFLEKTGAPVVVKASGLCAGKGAVVCQTLEEARRTLHAMLGPDAAFGEAGREVVIEEFMAGQEASLFAICDGAHYALLPAAQDHKRAYDNDEGPNTGGMGAYAPAPLMTRELLERTCREIVEPTLAGMRREGYPYHGVLYVGLMMTPQGPKVVEYNCRFGDPETQAVLPVFPGDLLDLLLASAQENLSELPAQPTTTAKAAAVVVLASGGYPGAYRSGIPIQGLEDAAAIPGTHVLQAGTRIQTGTLTTAGGRVLGVVGEADTLAQALEKAYSAVGRIRFEGMHFRRDIGRRSLD